MSAPMPLALPTHLQQPDWAALYAEHLVCQRQHYEAVMASWGLDSLLIAAGTPGYFYRDDIQRPFRANAHFLSWLPLTQHPGCYLWLRVGEKPRLFYLKQQDFWHQPPADPSGFWVDHFDIEIIQSDTEVANKLNPDSGVIGYLGEHEALAREWGITQVNPPAFIAELNWQRAYKTDYEQACLAAANCLAVKGHHAASAAFAEGQSEYGIHLAYLAACQVQDAELPYPNIIGVNEHAAILHYQHLDRSRAVPCRSLLIDAGANQYGYAADITRTYAAETGMFADLIAGVDALQRHLIEAIAPGLDYGQLHQRACLAIAELLQQLGIVKLAADQQLERGLVTRFFPHGLGHLLGLQVHDVGGWQADPQGNLREPPGAHPFLRLTRELDANMVFTIEPGVYFIPALLEPLRASENAQYVDWHLVDQLSPYGGVRIEDDVLLTKEGAVNLTRHAFAALT